MENLFYLPKENLLFNVAGYTDNSQKVKDITVMLNENAKKLATVAGVSPDDVKTIMVERSRRYKSMRVFYCNPQNVPAGAYIIEGDDWNMWKWLEN